MFGANSLENQLESVNYDYEVDENYDTVERSNRIDENLEAFEKDTILCVLWKNGKLGAAYYKISDQQLYFVCETIDLQPTFAATKTLISQIHPQHTLTIGGNCDQFPQFLAEYLKVSDDNSDSTTFQLKLPENLSILPAKDYSFEACQTYLTNLKLASETDNTSEKEHEELFLYSLIDADSRMSVYALGALVKFTEKFWSHLSNGNNQELVFLHVNQINFSDQLMIDKSTFNGLQIFQSCGHDAGFKRWTSSNHEGHSIFKIFSQNCKSYLGLKCLKNLLCTPTNNIDLLRKRLDFIGFVSEPTRQGFVESLQENVKKIADVNEIFRKVRNTRATHKDWENLYITIYHTSFLNELCTSYRNKCQLLQDLASSVTDSLYDLQHTMNNALDFKTTGKHKRPLIKFGLDEELDAKKLRRQDLAKHVTAAADLAVTKLPEIFSECSIVYVPELGHLIAVKLKSESECSQSVLKEANFQFMFEVHGAKHYKNPLCIELDKYLTKDVHKDIMAHEDRIIQRLSGFVITHINDIRKPLEIIALIDCLISAAITSKKLSYVKPTLNNQNVHDIRGGRHPLLEITCTNYVSNDFVSGGDNSHLKILTGPNDSGKSVYLKQVALLIYLAHVGLYVPAKKANIGMVQGIYSRILLNESTAISLSAFMLDLTQMSHALHNAKSNSLIIIDEFGRGTDEDDGVALLTAALKKFLDQDEHCPHILVSTHFQKICSLLPRGLRIEHLKLDYVVQEDETLIFLYKVVEGVSNSFAFSAAAKILDKDIVVRAKQLYQVLYMNRSLHDPVNITDCDEHLFQLNIPELDTD